MLEESHLVRNVGVSANTLMVEIYANVALLYYCSAVHVYVEYPEYALHDCLTCRAQAHKGSAVCGVVLGPVCPRMFPLLVCIGR